MPHKQYSTDHSFPQRKKGLFPFTCIAFLIGYLKGSVFMAPEVANTAHKPSNRVTNSALSILLGSP